MSSTPNTTWAPGSGKWLIFGLTLCGCSAAPTFESPRIRTTTSEILSAESADERREITSRLSDPAYKRISISKLPGSGSSGHSDLNSDQSADDVVVSRKPIGTSRTAGFGRRETGVSSSAGSKPRDGRQAMAASGSTKRRSGKIQQVSGESLEQIPSELAFADATDSGSIADLLSTTDSVREAAYEQPGDVATDDELSATQPAPPEGAAGPATGSSGSAPDSRFRSSNPAQPETAQRPARPKDYLERLKIPEGMPGAGIPDIPGFGDASDPLYKARVDRYFPDVGVEREAVLPDEQSGVMSLQQLQEIALANNPVIAQAAAAIDKTTGAAIQAGVYPNPVVGYEGDTVGSSGTRNYHGVYVQQTFKTAGKLDLQRSAANVDLMNSQLDLRQARVELLTNVRNAYYAVLVAEESVRAAQALQFFTAEVYKIQVDQLKGGIAAPYQPMQLRALNLQSRVTLLQAENRYISAWKQLATQIGVPDMPIASLTDSATTPVPQIDYDAALTRILSIHTDLLAARNSEAQARIRLRLAEVTPVPDVQLYTGVLRDFTNTTGRGTAYNLQLGMPLPVFDRNVGGIQSAQGTLVQANREIPRIEYQLTQQFTDAYERYSNGRMQVEFYRNRIIPDLVLAYRRIYLFSNVEDDPARGGANFGDIVVAQQNLQNAITQYLSALSAQWTALNDIARLMQVESLVDINRDPDAPGAANAPPPAAGVPVPEPAP